MQQIEFQHVSFNYSNRQEHPILQDLTFTLPVGSSTAIIGPNGSGKSTLVKLMAGLLSPTSGQVTVQDGTVGIVFQNPENQFVGSTVAEDVAFGLENQQIPTSQMPARIHNALQQVGMLDYAHSAVDQLSGGQKQRVAIAGVLAMQPAVMIFDEATSMLDPLGRQQVMDIIDSLAKSGMTIVSVTHHLDEAERVDQILALQQGKIVAAGPSHQVLANQVLVDQLELIPAPGAALKAALANRQITVPDEYQTTEEVVSWLSKQLHSNQ